MLTVVRTRERARVPHVDSSPKAVALRLRIARTALNRNQIQFAELAGITPQAYNNWETGRQRPSIEQAIKLCNAHGLTLDFIYRGELAGLRYEVHDAASKALRSGAR